MRLRHTAAWSILGILGVVVSLSRVDLSQLSTPSVYVDFDPPSSQNKIESSPGLAEAIEPLLQKLEGKVAVYVESLIDGERYILNEREVFEAASLYKLVLLAAVLKETEDGPPTERAGRLKTEDKLVSDVAYLEQVLGSKELGYEKVGRVEYTVEEAIKRVGEISDNFAAIMLVDKLGERKKLQDMAQSLGMADTLFNLSRDQQTLPTTTAYDMAVFFKKLYAGEVVSGKSSQKIEKLLLSSQINNRIPKYLPPEIGVAHKTGELPGIRHDAGIVYLPERPYILVLMSRDLKFEDEGVEALAKISQAVYEYFNNRSN